MKEIFERRSIRKYRSEKVEKVKVLSIISLPIHSKDRVF
jgi:hypothetical protein